MINGVYDTLGTNKSPTAKHRNLQGNLQKLSQGRPGHDLRMPELDEVNRGEMGWAMDDKTGSSTSFYHWMIREVWRLLSFSPSISELEFNVEKGRVISVI